MSDRQSTQAGTDAKYRVTREFSSAIASEPNLQAILSRTFEIMSRVVPLGALVLLLRDEHRGLAKVHALQAGSRHTEIDIGPELMLEGTTMGLAIEAEKPLFIEDGQEELAKLPQMAACLKGEPVHCFYAIPLSTSRRRLGLLLAATSESGAFSPDDAEIMDFVGTGLSIVLDRALAFESAQQYQRELVRERDRLKLLLDINNHVMSLLEIDEFFHAASTSIQKFFGSDFTGFWLLDEKSKRLNCAVLDFPSRRNALTKFDIPGITEKLMQKLRAGAPVIETLADVEAQFPLAVSAPLRNESIVSFVHMPLLARRCPIAVMSLGSRRMDAFSVRDMDLLTQVATQIGLALDNAIAYERLSVSRDQLEEQRVYLESEFVSESGFEDIVGRSEGLRKVLNQVQIVATTDSTVFIHGETGTGKELIARAIHRRSPRSNRTFVRLNCAAIPSGLLESELFGHEKGAFTGALTQRRGRFELADRGTLFLDEIGDISLEIQPKLLRAIQEHEFERLGNTRTFHVDVRIIAATHKDLREMLRDETFREDLFYRLNVFPIHVPPLRERREDIPLLVEYFVSRLCRRMRRPVPSISRGTLDALMAWDWPGNIRELENFIERAIILSSGDRLNAPLAELAASSAPITPVLTHRDSERKTIIAALRATKGKITGPGGAAERLDIKRTTLQYRMRRLGISRDEYQLRNDLPSGHSSTRD